MSGHNCLHLTAIFMACVTFAASVLFTSGVLGQKLGIFLNNSSSVSDKFYLDKYRMDVTPADWTFYLPALIYVWQAVWLAYGISLTCRRNECGYLYQAYPVIPPILYVVFSFSLACNVSWLLIWDREYLEVALVFINLMACTLYICLIVSLRRLNEFGQLMASEDLLDDIWMLRILVQNGLAFYATWASVASIFNFAVVLTYRTGAKQEVGSVVALTVFTLEIFAFWVFDNFVFEHLFRYLVTPYLGVTVALIGIISKNWNPGTTNSIYAVTLLVLTSFFTAFKFVFCVYKHYKQPLVNIKPKYKQESIDLEVRTFIGRGTRC